MKTNLNRLRRYVLIASHRRARCRAISAPYDPISPRSIRKQWHDVGFLCNRALGNFLNYLERCLALPDVIQPIDTKELRRLAFIAIQRRDHFCNMDLPKKTDSEEAIAQRLQELDDAFLRLLEADYTLLDYLEERFDIQV